jgi:hypothetical protein
MVKGAAEKVKPGFSSLQTAWGDLNYRREDN